MISQLLFDRTVVPDMEKGMNAYALRQKTLADNIANVMTPGYQAKRVSFEEEYRKTLYPVKHPEPEIKLAITNEKHIPTPPPPRNMTFRDVNPTVVLKDAPMNDSGLNNVDIDREMAEMAENSLRYEMATRLTNKRFANIRSSIRGR